MRTSSPEGTAEFLPQEAENEKTHGTRSIHPSLRDGRDIASEPGSELPGYSQISLREKENAGPKSSKSSVVSLSVLSRIRNPQGAGEHGRSADCKSAIQQSSTLRYFDSGCEALHS
jgi:hypothetical protein